MTDFHMPDSWYDPPTDEGCECECGPCLDDGSCEECELGHPFYDDDYYDDEPADYDDEKEEDWNDD